MQSNNVPYPHFLVQKIQQSGTINNPNQRGKKRFNNVKGKEKKMTN